MAGGDGTSTTIDVQAAGPVNGGEVFATYQMVTSDHFGLVALANLGTGTVADVVRVHSSPQVVATYATGRLRGSLGLTVPISSTGGVTSVGWTPSFDLWGRW